MFIVHTHSSKTPKKKKKWASAEQKRNALALEKSWEDLKKRHSSKTSITKPVSVINKSPVQLNQTTDNKPKSLNSWITGAVSSKPNQQYTGNNVKGIVVQHKSCLQPVFSQEEAIDSARMRRG